MGGGRVPVGAVAALSCCTLSASLTFNTAMALGYSRAFAGAQRPVHVVHDRPIFSLSGAGGGLAGPDSIRSRRR